jgi:hypothetical protein
VIWANTLSTKFDVYSYSVTLLKLDVGCRCFERGGGVSSSDDEKPEFFPYGVGKDGLKRAHGPGGCGHGAHQQGGRCRQRGGGCGDEGDTLLPCPAPVDMLEGHVTVHLPPESHHRELLGARSSRFMTPCLTFSFSSELCFKYC